MCQFITDSPIIAGPILELSQLHLDKNQLLRIRDLLEDYQSTVRDSVTLRHSQNSVDQPSTEYSRDSLYHRLSEATAAATDPSDPIYDLLHEFQLIHRFLGSPEPAST
jgi:hypothetical protein